MFNLLLTILIPLVICCFSILKIKNGKATNCLSKEYTNAIKGLCAIVVIYVHVPEGYGNPLQDMIGSFAYVAVTFFFLVSAYGMNSSATYKADYLVNFWRNRLIALLVPMAAVNVFRLIVFFFALDALKLDYLYDINMYVVVLLGYCLLFWIVKSIQKRFSFINSVADYLLICGVLVSSLSLYLFTYNDISASSCWCFEQFGLIWGILLSRYKNRMFNCFAKSPWLSRLVLTILAFIFGVSYLKFKTVFFVGEYVLKIILGAIILLTLFAWTDALRIDNKFTKFIGDISYEVYLLHGFFLITIGTVFFESFSSGEYIFSVIILTMVSGAVVHLFDKHIIKLLRKH